MVVRADGVWKGRSRLSVAIAASLVVGGLGAIVVARHAVRPAAGTQQSMTIQPRPFASTLSLVGTIVPGDSIDVVAPFDGVVKSVGFAYGVGVTPGQVLVELDAGEVAQRRNEAEAGYLKASRTAEELANWSAGSEASRARRAVDAAISDLSDLDRKIGEVKALLDRGLVARGEYDGLVQQRRSQELALAAARQDLAGVLARGQGSSRREAALELQNARLQLARLDTQMVGAVVRAPAGGVIVRPTGKAEAAEAIHAGQAVTRGQLIGSIARAGGLAVAFQLSETDANRVRPGMAVKVTGPGFGDLSATGHISAVAGEAAPATAAGGPLASFPAVARLDGLTPQQATAMRIGMTANVVVDLYRNAAALVAPPAAIQGAAPAAWVRVRVSPGGDTRVAPVKLGQAAPDGVEILSGLKAGDVLVWDSPPVAGASPP
jgi:multidrug resistance efflux pump